MSYEENQNEKYVEKMYNAKSKNQQTSSSYLLQKSTKISMKNTNWSFWPLW